MDGCEAIQPTSQSARRPTAIVPYRLADRLRAVQARASRPPHSRVPTCDSLFAASTHPALLAQALLIFQPA